MGVVCLKFFHIFNLHSAHRGQTVIRDFLDIVMLNCGHWVTLSLSNTKY